MLRTVDSEAVWELRRVIALRNGSTFDDAAIASAYGACGGSIRQLNNIVVNAMMIGSQAEMRRIGAETVLKAIEEASLE